MTIGRHKRAPAKARARDHDRSAGGGRCREVFLYDSRDGSGLHALRVTPAALARWDRLARPPACGFLGISCAQPDRRRHAVLRKLRRAGAPAGDGRNNVYEFERGRSYPISNVTGGHESYFLDASASGEDVFFATADRLLPEDASGNIVVYDARVDGGFPVTTALLRATTATRASRRLRGSRRSSPRPRARRSPGRATSRHHRPRCLNSHPNAHARPAAGARAEGVQAPAQARPCDLRAGRTQAVRLEEREEEERTMTA